MLSQLSGCGLGPKGARTTACAAPSAAPDSASASAPAAVCAARGPSPLAIHAGMLMPAPLPRPRPAATALARVVALVSPAAVPPSAAPTAVVAPATTGPFDIHAGRLTSPPRPRPPGGRMGVTGPKGARATACAAPSAAPFWWRCQVYTCPAATALVAFGDATPNHPNHILCGGWGGRH